MEHQDVEVLAVGAGPSNLALGVALEELAPEELAGDTLLVEQGDCVAWQRGMLLPWSQSQVSFIKDFVTLRNPRSRFSFLNYLHENDRLDDFVNLGTFTPYRSEISGYHRWVAESFEKVRVRYNSRCTSVEPRRDGAGALVGWLVRLADGSTVGARHLVFGSGRDALVPEVFAGLPAAKVVHSTQYLPRIAELSKDLPYRVVVVGGAQSAGELFHSVQDELPHCRPTWVMRSIGLNSYENSKFTNELFYPSFTDEFFAADAPARTQLLREMHRTNYAGLAPDFLETLYRQFYNQRLTGGDRLAMRTMTDITAARMDDDEVVLELSNRRTGEREELRADLVLLGTGFVPEMPRLLRDLAADLGVQHFDVTRAYRWDLGQDTAATVHLQGVNEATHGISDSLLSVLARRSSEITADLLARRGTAPGVLIPSQGTAAPAAA
ncbi:lysine N(6)-hydroxylase/L-ornithine N(5)-oxygenase family protein [Kitasatospora sp. NPDC088134]|uniref:lysine N(6)-hydroxylase/L-ornithine N(5)-oxygenase family protein n=1 Tax=Kitasatospora sp. NPDC088134 TaxID=3364071 RepID=UPI0038265A5C